MDNHSYDAIVIGARCAGSPAAMLLARQGHRVLVVDRATFPSDTLSTHMIHAPGVAALDRWGLLDRVVATGCPPIGRYELDFGFFTLRGAPRPVDGHSVGYAPRRTVLDAILVDAARDAGAEVREGFTVEEILIEGGTVTGIVGHGPDGRQVVERARFVIGADGTNSLVARAVQPAVHHEKPVLQTGAYTYWSGLPCEAFEVYVGPDRGVGALPTNDGLTLVVLGWPAVERDAFRTDVEANYLATLELFPALAERVRSATRVDRFHLAAVPNFFRTQHGPGWVLIGDAGYTKDPITAQGIPDAFLDAERVAAALDDVLCGRRTADDALTDSQRQRDEHAMAVYEFTTQLATLALPPPEVQQLLAASAGNPEATDGFVSILAGTMSPVEFFDPANVARIMAAGATAA
jgi:2-polyprenyl-6-methoxyphenol hydroxylase-like FAD-dependent oxidoreductase